MEIIHNNGTVTIIIKMCKSRFIIIDRHKNNYVKSKNYY